MILKNLLYILQRESYQANRFLAFVYKNYQWWSLAKRQKIVWTIKAKLIFFITLVLFWFLVGGTCYFNLIIGLFVFIVLIPFLPFLLLTSLLLIKPLDYLLKKNIIIKAYNILKIAQPIVIGITGSYGKTSTKEILIKILEQKFSVLKTPENINTDLGIANYIIKQKDNLKKAKIFIVEMGAYQRGDIKTICDLVKPNYSILTGINEAHLERFGNLQNTIKAKYELAEATSDLALLNFSDKNIKENVGFFKIKKYQGVSSELVSDIKIKENFLGLEFTYRQQKFSTVLLAKHNIDLIILSVELALSLGLDLPTIAEGVSKVEVVEHRLQPIFNPYTKVVVIDDSYNGNYAGFLSGLEVLSRASGRKIVLTPGLVELGKESEKIHRQLAHVYAEQKIDQVLLIKNSATIYIKEEFDKIGFKNYFLYNSTLEAHNNLKEILKTGDTIIFQNDWPDNYN